MIYREAYQDTKDRKQKYFSGIESFIEREMKKAELRRKEYIKDIFDDPEKYREKFRKLLGYPLCGEMDHKPIDVKSTKLSEEEKYTIYRMQYEMIDGITMTGLFFRVKGYEKRPLVIVQHGGLGTPEAISGMYGSTSNYNDMLQRVIKHDVHVFAPQLLLWADKKYDVPFDRYEIDNKLKSVGSSIAALELYGIMRGLDYFETLPEVDKFGMVGLSYGGFYTQCMAALDTRILSAISCSYFNRREACFHSDWTWFDSLNHFGDAELACLVYPRRLCIELGRSDDLFACEDGIKEFEKLKELCAPRAMDWVDLILFDGGHEFCRDDVSIAQLIADIR